MTELGLVGIVDKGVYDSSTTYSAGNFFLYEGSTYLVLRDGVRNITPSDDRANYKYLARGIDATDAADIDVTDTQGYVVTAEEKTRLQRLIDFITEKMLKKTDISASGTITEKYKYALDATEKNPNVSGSLAEQVKNKLRVGNESMGEVAAGTYVDKAVTFSSEFSSTPRVVAVLTSASTSADMGSFSVSAINITKSGFTIRVFNNSSSNRSPAVTWMAALQN